MTIDDALVLFDSNPLPISLSYSLKEKIEAFFRRIEHKSGLPKALENLVTEPQLKAMYDYIKNPINQAFLTKHLLTGIPYHLNKTNTGLARTLNIVFDPIRHDVQLILETKSKVINKKGFTKKGSVQVCTGTEKSIKPAWRIDTPIPIKMANAVYYAKGDSNNNPNALEDARINASLATHVAKLGGSPAEKLMNLTAVGVVMYKKDVRSYTPNFSYEPYYAKQSFYSEYAIGDLERILSHSMKYPITATLRNNMTHDLLLSLKFMQDAEVIHQDLKTRNILVFPDAKMGYTLKICDFGSAYHPSIMPFPKPIATIAYESPEISALYDQVAPFKQKNYGYFHGQSRFYSYGKEVYKLNRTKISVEQLNTYSKPHNANDLWALGIVLHELYFNTRKPTVKNNCFDNHYLGGLIDFNRETRLTIDKALDLFIEANPKFKTDDQLKLSASAQPFVPKFNHNNNLCNAVDQVSKNLDTLTISGNRYFPGK